MLYSEQISNALIITSGWMAGRPEVGTIVFFQRLHQLRKVQVFIDPYQQVVGIDEVPQLLGGELEQGGIAAQSVQRLESSASSATTDCPGIVAEHHAKIGCRPDFSTSRLLRP